MDQHTPQSKGTAKPISKQTTVLPSEASCLEDGKTAIQCIKALFAAIDQLGDEDIVSPQWA